MLRMGERILNNKKKLLGEERRNFILDLLINSEAPITGNELAEKTNVSRQVIVQDISLLKAKNHTIIATSQGYMYMKQIPSVKKSSTIIACNHTREQMELELQLLIDCGVTVKDVTVEHPIYGDLTAPLMLKTREDVTQFTKKMKEKNASLLSELTNGIHLHTIEADHPANLTKAQNVLKQHGFLLTSD